jgi:hypothetical protein
MTDLSLYLLDIVENSLAVKASEISVNINVDSLANRLVLTITDNGIGMNETALQRAADPFFTTRTTRKVGLGLAILKSAAIMAGGDFFISSKIGLGTSVMASFQLNNIDRPPLGDISASILAIIYHQDCQGFSFRSINGNRTFEFALDPIRQAIDPVPLTDALIIQYLKQHLQENIAICLGGII